ncbi:hypothetical protein SteCoe_20086 [Stentor coeruleus]|uniref:Uncharacterized protein n=1 Tax=Stentor coeruleus TaxID=5963 RepID=A0A1R2BSP3_9CILI|nr:hypothetical protein SteCoe_20086 [Stentor coeruleus]
MKNITRVTQLTIDDSVQESMEVLSNLNKDIWQHHNILGCIKKSKLNNYKQILQSLQETLVSFQNLSLLQNNLISNLESLNTLITISPCYLYNPPQHIEKPLNYQRKNINDIVKKVKNEIQIGELQENINILQDHFDYVHKESPSSYIVLIKYLQVNRRKVVNFKYFNENYMSYSHSAKKFQRLYIEEHNIMEKLIDPNQLSNIIQYIFQDITKSIRKILKTQTFTYKLPELIQFATIMQSLVSLPIKSISKIIKLCNIHIENHTEKLISCLSSLSSMNFLSVPYLLKLVIIEFYYTASILYGDIKNQYWDSLIIENICKISSYFYDLTNISTCVFSLNVQNYIFTWFPIEKSLNLSETIHTIKNRLAELVSEKIVNENSGFGQDFCISFINLYYKVLKQQVFSYEIGYIEGKELQKDVKLMVGHRIIQRYKQSPHPEIKLLYSEELFCKLLK